MRLICKLINGEELEFEISKPSFIIGRSSQADIVIPHEGMSRKHCLIENKNGQLFITDLESANGVFIDEKRIPTNQPTSVPEYLNLSFGAVQTLLIENTELSPQAPLNPVSHTQTSPSISRKETADILTKTTTLKRQHHSGKHEISKKKSVSEPKSSKQVIYLIATILVLGLMGYLYYQDQSAMNAPMSHEEMYE